MMNDTNKSNWEIFRTGREEILTTGLLSSEDVSSYTVYRLIPPRDESLASKDFVTLTGTLTCACGYEIPLKATIYFKGWLTAPSKHLKTCPQCWRSIELSGHTTGADGSERQWLLVTPRTGREGVVEMPGTMSGLPEISIDSVERIPDESEGLKRWEEALGTASKIEEEPVSSISESIHPIDKPSFEETAERFEDDRLPSEVIWDLFEERQLDPMGKSIIAFVMLYEREFAPAVWVGPGPDPFASEGESKQTRNLRFLASKIVPGYQPHFIPGHLRIDKKTAVTGREFEPGENLDSGYINRVLAVMLEDLIEDHDLVDDQELRNCSALSLSGNSPALGEGRFALLVR